MRVFLCECTCAYLCDSVFSWLPDTLKPMYVCDLFLPRMDVFFVLFFHLKLTVCIRLSFSFLILSYMQICTKKKKQNCVDIYVLHIILLSSITTE